MHIAAITTKICPSLKVLYVNRSKFFDIMNDSVRIANSIIVSWAQEYTIPVEYFVTLVKTAQGHTVENRF